MKIILFRFEKEKINFVECDIGSGNIIIGDKESIPLESTETRGEKYNKILDELLHINTKYSATLFAYHSPQKYMGAIRDEEGFANSAIFNLFCYQNSITLLELTPAIVRQKLSIPNKEYKSIFEKEKIDVTKKYNLAKSDKLLEGLVFISLLRNVLQP